MIDDAACEFLAFTLASFYSLGGFCVTSKLRIRISSERIVGATTQPQTLVVIVLDLEHGWLIELVDHRIIILTTLQIQCFFFFLWLARIQFVLW